nr:relaxase/mobilization nuclease domain-containing protein [Endozoicomonas sp.]
MIADDKKTGNISHGIKQATYMLDPAAKSPQNKMGEKESNPDRVLLVITEHALPVLASSPPKASARQFMQSINEWNRRHRNGQKPPARSWQHIAISFSPKDHEQVSPKRAVAIACHALRLVAGGKRPVLYVVHGDTQHVHVHLQFGTVNDKGKIHSIH